MNPQSVAAAVFSPDRSQVLLIKRRDVPVWVLPGGGIDPQETPDSAVIREIFEETGFTVKVSRLVGHYQPINKLAKSTHLYECHIVSGAALQSTSETLGAQFFPINSLPEMPPPYAEWIQDAVENQELIVKKLSSVTYWNLAKHALAHPVLVLRFLLARAGLAINS